MATTTRLQIGNVYLWLVAAVWGGILVVAIALLGFKLELIVVVAVAAVGFVMLFQVETYRLVFSLLLLALFLNVANYTFLVWDVGGRPIQSAESRFLALLRLPIVLLAVMAVLRSYGGRFITYLRSNWDVVMFAIVPFFGIAFAFEKGPAFEYALWLFSCLLAILAFFFVLAVRQPIFRWSDQIGLLLLLGNVVVVGLAFGGFTDIISAGQTDVRTAAYSPTNIFALGCSIVVVAVLVLERHRLSPASPRWLRRFPVLLMGALVVVSGVLLVFSAKRGPIVAVGIAVIVYLIAVRRAPVGTGAGRYFSTLLILGCVVGSGYLLLTRAETTLLRFGKLANEDENQSVQIRLDILKISAAVVAEYPVFGVGLSNGPEATGRLVPWSDVAGYGLHNTYLSYLLETGLLGFGLFLILCVRSLLLWRNAPFRPFKWDLVIVALPGVLVALTETASTPGQYMFWPLWLSVLMPRALLALPSARSIPSSELTVPNEVHPGDRTIPRSAKAR